MRDIFSPENIEPDTAEQGVTLIELLTVIAIISIAVGIPFVTMLNQRHNATLEEGQATVMQALNTTRSRAVTGVGDADMPGHVACVREGGVEVFTQEACPGDCSACVGGEMHSLPPGIVAEEVRIPFSRLDGASANTSIDIMGFGGTRTITVSDHGFIQ